MAIVPRLALVVSILFLFPLWAEPSGFSIYDFGAKEQSQGDAVVAQVESPSAVFYNPAGLSDLDGIQLKVGTSMLFSKITFRSDMTGTDTRIEPGPFLPSYLFVTSRLNDRWSAGFGVFSAIGNKVEYPKDWEGRFFLTSSELLQLNFSPTLAYKVSEALSIGGGAVVTYATFKRANQINLEPLQGEGALDLNADGVEVGGLIGAKLKLGASTLGVVYKSPMTITFKGDADFSVPGPAGVFFQDGNIRSTQKFPQMVVVGFAHQPAPEMTLEVDLQWTNWNSFNEQTLRFENPVLGIQEVTVPFRWKDTWTVRVGGHYDVTHSLNIRLGYVFDPSAVPGETLSPFIPELDKHIVEGGIGFQEGQWAVDVFYGVIFGQSRKVDNALPAMPVHRGTYDASGHGGGLSVRYRF